MKDAQEADAEQHAPLELRLAREKLERSRRAMDDVNYVDARRLAEQAFIAPARIVAGVEQMIPREAAAGRQPGR